MTLLPEKPLILLVEDEPGIADTVQYALRTDGFDCLWCATAGEALAAIADRSPDLMVLDVGLPDMNGFELFKRLRQQADWPVLFLTARSAEIDRVVGLELGADDYVSKPFSPRELVARIRTILRRTVKAPTPPALPVSPAAFTLDEGRRQIRFFGSPLELSRYEYGLLKVLMRRPGHVYSREILLDLVWDERSASLDRTVDAHVKTLRAKLKLIAPMVDPIRTHRGSGYSLAEDLPAQAG